MIDWVSYEKHYQFLLNFPSILSVLSEQASVGELAECQRKKGEDLKCNKLDSDPQDEGGLKKNLSKTELPPLTSDKDAVQAKSKCQTEKACRSQSGPLMPGVELSHSASERAGNFERSYTVLFDLLCHVFPKAILNLMIPEQIVVSISSCNQVLC